MVQVDLLAWQPRHEAAERATAHADRKSPGWGVDAYIALERFLERCGVGVTFITEQYVEAAIAAGLAEPPTRRAFGAIVGRAKRAGLIVADGFELDKYASPKTRWRRR